jgi:hypothetical protein
MSLRRTLLQKALYSVHEVKLTPTFFRSFSAFHLPKIQKALVAVTHPAQNDNIKKTLLEVYEKNQMTRTILDALEKQTHNNLVLIKSNNSNQDRELHKDNYSSLGNCEFNPDSSSATIWIASDEAIEKRMKDRLLFDKKMELAILHIFMHEATHYCEFVIEQNKKDRSVELDNQLLLALDHDLTHLQHSNQNNFPIQLIKEILKNIKKYPVDQVLSEWKAHFTQMALKLSDKELQETTPKTYHWFIHEFGGELRSLPSKNDVESQALSVRAKSNQ